MVLRNFKKTDPILANYTEPMMQDPSLAGVPDFWRSAYDLPALTQPQKGKVQDSEYEAPILNPPFVPTQKAGGKKNMMKKALPYLALAFAALMPSAKKPIDPPVYQTPPGGAMSMPGLAPLAPRQQIMTQPLQQKDFRRF